MKELSIFVDESGGQNGISKYCLITIVLHNQEDFLHSYINSYENALSNKGLPNIPMHASPLLYGKGDYAHLDHETRHQLLASFFVFCRKLPIQYKTFVYRRSEIIDTSAFIARLKRDIAVFLVDNLQFFQSFAKVKIYYDNGQHMISEALHEAINFALAKDSILFKKASPPNYRLFQAADFLCTIELAAVKYGNREETKTDTKMFGNATSFKKGI